MKYVGSIHTSYFEEDLSSRGDYMTYRSSDGKNWQCARFDIKKGMGSRSKCGMPNSLRYYSKLKEGDKVLLISDKEDTIETVVTTPMDNTYNIGTKEGVFNINSITII